MTYPFDIYQTDILRFCHDVLRIEPKEHFHSWQLTVLTEFEKGLKENTQTEKYAIVGCKNAGKTHIHAILAVHGLLTLRQLNIMVISGSVQQSKDVLMKEIKKILLLNTILVENWVTILQSKVKFKTKTLEYARQSEISVVAAPKSKKESSISSGRHATNEYVLADEVDAIPWESLQQLLPSISSGFTRLIFTANPEIQDGTRTLSYIGQVMTGVHDLRGDDDGLPWKKFSINLLRDCEKMSPERVRAIEKQNGYPDIKNPLYIRNVLGEYQKQGNISTLFEINTLRKTLSPINMRLSEYKQFVVAKRGGHILTDGVYGVDVAYGVQRNYSVVAYRRGMHVIILICTNKITDTELAKRILEFYHTFAKTEVFIDGLGIGASVYNRLNAIIPITPANTEKIVQDSICHDKQMLLYDFVSILLAKGLLKVSCLSDTLNAERSLVVESSQIVVGYTPVGKKYIVNKHRTTHTSPDVLDAISYTFSKYETRETFEKYLYHPLFLKSVSN